MPGEYTTLAEFHISLDEFLEGEYVFENVFVKDWHEASGLQTPTSEMSGTSKVSHLLNLLVWITAIKLFLHVSRPPPHTYRKRLFKLLEKSYLSIWESHW